MGMRGAWTVAFALAGAFGLAGCGGSSGPPKSDGPGGTPTAKEALGNLVDVLTWLDSQKKRLPAQASDLEPIEPLFPGAYVALVRGDIAYHWGLPLRATEPGRVLAFEKKVETDAGWVLFQDGTLKQLTTDEFRAAPKAK